MKSKLRTLIPFVFFITTIGFAQNSKPSPANITVFSESGDKFKLYIAGIQMNKLPAAIVVAKEIRGSSVSLKIVFENNAIPSIIKKVTRSAVKDVIYAIAKDPKENYFLKTVTKVTIDTTLATKSIESAMPSESSKPVETTGLTDVKKDSATTPKTTIITEDKPSVNITPTEVSVTKPASNVLINGQPAQTTITTNSTGTPVLKAENATGSVKIDPSKEYHSPTIGGVPAKDFGDALGDAFDQTFSGKPSPAQTQTTAATPTVNTNTHPAAIGTATFYSENGEKFILMFNGMQANATPLSNVAVSNVSVIRFSVNVVFQDATIASINKTMMRMAKDCTYAIKKNKKGEFVLKLVSAVGAL